MFGGPIKRNKMFAFAAYQRWEADQTQSNTQATVPTAANLTGDFSVHGRRSRRYRQQSLQFNSRPDSAGRPANRHSTGGKQICDAADVHRAGAGTAKVSAA